MMAMFMKTAICTFKDVETKCCMNTFTFPYEKCQMETTHKCDNKCVCVYMGECEIERVEFFF